jgi:hypothetical protein
MPRDRQAIGLCTRCNHGTKTCTYNKFLNATREIHSWEHRCSDCAHRETKAFRSDDSEADPTSDPTVCPFCGRQGAA